VDFLWGVGGTPEGVISACAVKCMGGALIGRLWPRDDDERRAAADAGYDLERVLTVDDLVKGDDIFFACTGITDGALVQGVRFFTDGATTESIVMRASSGTIRVVRGEHRAGKLQLVCGEIL
jgi:fructose-1,6-bisphosphatase II